MPGELKRFLLQYLPGGDGGGGEAYYVPCIKRDVLNYGFEGSILNVDLGRLYPNNQLMFGFVAF